MIAPLGVDLIDSGDDRIFGGKDTKGCWAHLSYPLSLSNLFKALQ